MKKKGFTLVELLAVIAILAILVIMALPAVLSMFTKARVDTFQNEVRTIYRTAQQQYLLGQGAAVKYGTGTSCTKLEMTGNGNLQYYIEINGSGQVTTIQAKNGTYGYTKTDANGFDIDDITVPSTPATDAATTISNCN